MLVIILDDNQFIPVYTQTPSNNLLQQ